MSRFGSWTLSAVIHGALLVGATLPALVRTGSIGFEDGDVRGVSGFVCRIGPPPDAIDPEGPAAQPAPIEDSELRGATEGRRLPKTPSCMEIRRSGVPCQRCARGIPWAKRPHWVSLIADCSKSTGARGTFLDVREECGFGRELEFEERRFR